MKKLCFQHQPERNDENDNENNDIRNNVPTSGSQCRWLRGVAFTLFLHLSKRQFIVFVIINIIVIIIGIIIIMIVISNIVSSPVL